MNIIYVFGIVFVCVVGALIIKESGSDSLGTFIVCFIIVVVGAFSVSTLATFVRKMLSGVDSLPIRYTDVVLKSFGIAFVGEIGADIIEELGSHNVAKYFLFAAKVEILCLCLAPITDLLEQLFMLSGQAFG